MRLSGKRIQPLKIRAYDRLGQTVWTGASVDDGQETRYVQQTAYGYDGNGNRTRVQDGVTDLTTFTYDANDRLVLDQTTGTNAHVYTYGYDARGNRTLSTETGQRSSFSYDAATRLVTSAQGSLVTTYSYDANGNRTGVVSGSTRTTMAYDREDRLMRHEQDGSVATYLYDADGMKRVEIVDGVRTTLIWDGETILGARS